MVENPVPEVFSPLSLFENPRKLHFKAECHHGVFFFGTCETPDLCRELFKGSLVSYYSYLVLFINFVIRQVKSNFFINKYIFWFYLHSISNEVMVDRVYTALLYGVCYVKSRHSAKMSQYIESNFSCINKDDSFKS